MFYTIACVIVSLLILLLLSFNVVKHRRRLMIGMGVGEDENLQRAVRAHGNFVEYTPFFLAGFAATEYLGLHASLLVLIGIVYFTGRLLHAYSLLKREALTGNYKLRIVGMIMTFGCLVTLIVVLVIQLLAM